MSLPEGTSTKAFIIQLKNDASHDIDEFVKSNESEHYTWKGKMCICGEVTELHTNVEDYQTAMVDFDKHLKTDLEWIYEFESDVHQYDYHGDKLYLNNYVFSLKDDKENIYMFETTYKPYQYFYGKWHRVVDDIYTRYTKIPVSEISKLEMYLSPNVDHEYYNSDNYSEEYTNAEIDENPYHDSYDREDEDHDVDCKKYAQFKPIDFEYTGLDILESCYTKLGPKTKLSRETFSNDLALCEPFERVQVILGFIPCMMTNSGK
jgi:hypothetical protein